jgi:nitrous oxide reductase accessory protein NosL
MTAAQAHYLIDPELTICCSPSVLAFSSHEEALKFQKGFGGRIVNFHLAIEFLNPKHS